MNGVFVMCIIVSDRNLHILLFDAIAVFGTIQDAKKRRKPLQGAFDGLKPPSGMVFVWVKDVGIMADQFSIAAFLPRMARITSAGNFASRW